MEDDRDYPGTVSLTALCVNHSGRLLDMNPDAQYDARMHRCPSHDSLGVFVYHFSA